MYRDIAQASQRGLTFEELVALERLNQEDRWGEQNHEPFIWSAILGEEYGEFQQAILELSYDNRENKPNIEKELIQMAAVIKAICECAKRNHWILS